jgi:chromosome segregation ATPase
VTTSRKKTRSVADVVRQETQEETTDRTEPRVPLKIPEAIPVKAEVVADDGKVTQLERELKEAKASEKKLQQEIKQLQAKLKDQAASQEIKYDRLAAELTEAKATILQLAEQKKSAPPPPPAPAITIATQAHRSKAIQPAVLPRYPIQPIKAVAPRTSPDVGWMD